MNIRRRSVFAVVIVLVILVTVFVFSQILYVTDIFYVPSGDYFTATAIISHNQTIEAFINQTQTATAQVPTGTFTLVPSS